MLETECLQSALIPCSRERLRLSNNAANASVSDVRWNEMGLDHTRKGRLYLVFSFQASQGNSTLFILTILCKLINQTLLQQRGPLPSNMDVRCRSAC